MEGKIEGRRTRGRQRMRWHFQLNEHEFEQTPGDGEGQGTLACCNPWGHKESDMTKQLKNDNSEFNKNNHTIVKHAKME